ncbi:MAG: prohibitin family protein [Saprospiraceae bacterium]|nr:prohibitin family protein [Saprospiraceae bacterium]
MFLIILGLIILLVERLVMSNDIRLFKLRKPAFLFSLAFITIGALSSCFVQIDAGEVGVTTLFGKVQNGYLKSGLNFINPLCAVTTFSSKTQNYTMSGINDEGDKQGDDAIRVLTADGLEVVLDLTVLYRILPEKAPSILTDIGTNFRDVIVRPVTRTKIRDNAVYYDAIQLYSIKREEFQMRIFKDIEDNFKKRGLVLEQLLIRNISLPKSVRETIESKINAEQESQKMKFVLDKERQEAERKRVEAQGISDYQKILNINLTDKQLQYEMIKTQKEIATSPNTKIIFMNGKGSNPILLSDK